MEKVNRSYKSILRIFYKYREKMTSRMIYNRYEECNWRTMLINSVYQTLSRMIKDGKINRDEDGFYYIDNTEEWDIIIMCNSV